MHRLCRPAWRPPARRGGALIAVVIDQALKPRYLNVFIVFLSVWSIPATVALLRNLSASQWRCCSAATYNATSALGQTRLIFGRNHETIR